MNLYRILWKIVLENIHFLNQGGGNRNYEDSLREIVCEHRGRVKLNQDQNCGFGNGGVEALASGLCS